MHQSKIALAKQCFDKIIQDSTILIAEGLEVLLADAYTYKGMILMGGTLEEIDEAKATFNKALELVPTHMLARERLAILRRSLFEEGNFEFIYNKDSVAEENNNINSSNNAPKRPSVSGKFSSLK